MFTGYLKTHIHLSIQNVARFRRAVAALRLVPTRGHNERLDDEHAWVPPALEDTTRRTSRDPVPLVSSPEHRELLGIRMQNTTGCHRRGCDDAWDSARFPVCDADIGEHGNPVR